MGIHERKEREKEARREDIITAAEKVIFERGIATATMDEIAEAAELSKGTLYLYYKSKEDLCMAIGLRGTEIMYKMFQEAVSTGEPTLTLISNLGNAYFRYFREHRNYFRMLYFYENPDVHKNISEEMMQVCAETDIKVWKLVVDVIRRAIDEGLLHKGLDPMEVGVMLWSNSNGLMRMLDRYDTHWREKLGLDLEATLQRSNRLLLEAMMTEKAKEQFPGIIPYYDGEQG